MSCATDLVPERHVAATLPPAPQASYGIAIAANQTILLRKPLAKPSNRHIAPHRMRRRARGGRRALP